MLDGRPPWLRADRVRRRLSVRRANGSRRLAPEPGRRRAAPPSSGRRPADGEHVRRLDVEPSQKQKAAARGEVRERALGVARVPARSGFTRRSRYGCVVDPAAADQAHDSLGAGLEEADATAHDVVEYDRVDVLEVAGRPAGRVPVRPDIVQVPRVEAEAGNLRGKARGAASNSSSNALSPPACGWIFARTQYPSRANSETARMLPTIPAQAAPSRRGAGSERPAA